MQIPIYDIVVNLEDDNTFMSCISLVDEPAVEVDFQCFGKQRPVMKFGVTDTEKHCITGVAIRADVPIYRFSPEYGEYYVRFTKKTIEDIVLKYSKMNLWNSVSLNHSGQNIDSAVMTEFFIKSDTKCPKGFEEVEDGSLMVTYKITDDNLWDTLKNTDEINGFSIEIYADLVPTDEFVEEESFLEELMRWLQGEDFEVKKNFSIEKSSVVSAIEKGNVILIDEGGDKAVKYYPHSVGKKDGKDIVVLYNPDTKKWSVKTLSSIDGIVGKEKVGGFDYGDPTYKTIIDDDSVTVSRTVHTTTIPDLIHNRVMVMMTYDDEQPDPATGYRQVAVIAHGYTHAGGECIRVMEVFGDSRSAKDGTGMIPDYRLMLTKRIRSLKPMVGTAPWGWDILDSRVNLEGDKSMFPCIDHITREDLDK